MFVIKSLASAIALTLLLVSPVLAEESNDQERSFAETPAAGLMFIGGGFLVWKGLKGLLGGYPKTRNYNGVQSIGGRDVYQVEITEEDVYEAEFVD